ncbi:620_t:CDS:2 [Entrophospora sp. SA101]|nr:620_t:CDS:2 [Entrophospora sp. SA101]
MKYWDFMSSDRISFESGMLPDVILLGWIVPGRRETRTTVLERTTSSKVTEASLLMLFGVSTITLLGIHASPVHTVRSCLKIDKAPQSTEYYEEAQTHPEDQELFEYETNSSLSVVINSDIIQFKLQKLMWTILPKALLNIHKFET